MSADDDPTLPGRPSARLSTTPPRPLRTRRASLSTRSLRVVHEVAPLLAAAFALPDGPERDAQLEAAIGHAIDAGRESGDAMRVELERIRGELADALQAKALLQEKARRLTAALNDSNARLARLASADRTPDEGNTDDGGT